MTSFGMALAFPLAQSPDHLPHHAEKDFRVFGIKFKTLHQTPNFALARGFRSRLDVSAPVERLEQNSADLLIHAGSSFRRRGRARLRWTASRQFIEADGDGLSKIHRDVIFPSRDGQKPMAVAEVVIGQSDFLRTEQERDASSLQMLTQFRSGLIEATQGMLQFAIASRGRTNNQRAVGDGSGHGFVFFGVLENVGCAHGRTRLTKCNFVGIH